jgi:hypothetical protein
MVDKPVFLEPGSSLVPRRATDSTKTTGDTAALGREQISYGAREVVSWKNWPDAVLSDLRRTGIAPSRFETGVAGYPQSKRRPAGTYYRERGGWYVGDDLSHRNVFVKISATQDLEPLDGAARRLKARGLWTSATEVWLLGERKRLRWTAHRDSVDLSVSASERAVAAGVVPMPSTFIQCLMGVPEAIQRAVLDAIDFSVSPWGEAYAWGYNACPRPCNHAGPCERIVLAAINKSTWVLRSEASRVGTRSAGQATKLTGRAAAESDAIAP